MGQFAAEAWGANETPMIVGQSVEGGTNVVCSLSVVEEVYELVRFGFLD